MTWVHLWNANDIPSQSLRWLLPICHPSRSRKKKKRLIVWNFCMPVSQIFTLTQEQNQLPFLQGHMEECWRIPVTWLLIRGRKWQARQLMLISHTHTHPGTHTKRLPYCLFMLMGWVSEASSLFKLSYSIFFFYYDTWEIVPSSLYNKILKGTPKVMPIRNKKK